MDEQRLEEVLRAGPPDERPHRQGALARGLAERERRPAAGTFRVVLRPQPWPAYTGLFAVVVAIGLVAVLALANLPGPAASPPPSPTTSATPSQSLVPGRGAPAALIDRWVGTTRAIAGLAAPATRAILDIRGGGFRFDAGPGLPANLLDSSVTAVSDDVLRLVANTAAGGCQPFDEGTYRWSLSPRATTLTIEPLEDACPARGAAITGTWTHTACRLAESDCLGVVEAGSYTSTEFDPLGTGVAGQLTYTVPEGWANTNDFRNSYSIRPRSDYESDPSYDGNDTASGIYVYAASLPVSQPADCAAVQAPGVEIDAESMAAYFASLDALDVTDLGSMEIDGRPARVLDLTLNPSYVTPCPFSNGEPFRSLTMSAELGADGGVSGLGAAGRVRMYLLDAAPGRVTTIWIEVERSRFDALLAEAAPIVEGLEFAEPPPGT
jgi:hypothetical protein